MTTTKDYKPRKKWYANGLYSVLILLHVPLPGFAAEQDQIISYSNETVILVLSLLILLALLFYLVFRWWQRTEQASYLGGIFRESVFEFELSRRTRRVDEKLNRGELERMIRPTLEKYPMPPVPDDRLLVYMKSMGTRRPGMGSSLPGSRNAWDNDETHSINLNCEEMPEDIKSICQKYKQDESKYIEERNKWNMSLDQAISKEYQNQLDQARKAADVDLGVFRGRGATFVLEFTAVVVIIFTAAILAILAKLSPEQVGTLLAAIAGYVLGRSVNPAAEKEKKDTDNKNQNPNNGEQGDLAK